MKTTNTTLTATTLQMVRKVLSETALDLAVECHIDCHNSVEMPELCYQWVYDMEDFNNSAIRMWGVRKETYMKEYLRYSQQLLDDAKAWAKAEGHKKGMYVRWMENDLAQKNWYEEKLRTLYGF